MAVALPRAAREPSRDQRPRPGLATRIRRSYSQYWYAWAMVAPVVVVIGVLIGYPLVRGILYTFTDANSINVSHTIGVRRTPDTYSWVGFKNYVDTLTGPDNQFWPHFLWTVIWTAACVVLTYGTGLVLAVLLNRQVRGRAFYRVMLVLPWAVPTFVTAFAWRLLLTDHGAVNGLLGAVGLPQPSWLSSPLAQKVAAIAVNTWVGVPFMMLSLLGGMQSIPGELYEAAEMDGATPWQRFTTVTLPGLRPVSSTVILLGIIWTFNQFNIIRLLFGTTNSDGVQILVTYAFRLFYDQQPQDYAGAATVGVLVLSMLVVFTSFYRRWLKRSGQL